LIYRKKKYIIKTCFRGHLWTHKVW
jgi:hypothetical protein